MFNRVEKAFRFCLDWVWASIQNTFFWIDHTRDVCGVFMSQSLPLGDPRVLKAFAEFETAVYSHHV